MVCVRKRGLWKTHQSWPVYRIKKMQIILGAARYYSEGIVLNAIH